MKYALIAAAAASAALLSACGTVSSILDSDTEVKQVHVMGDIWQRTEVWKNPVEPMRAIETVKQNATYFCEKQKRGMQPLEQTATRGKKDKEGRVLSGTSVTLQFKCVSYVKYED